MRREGAIWSKLDKVCAVQAQDRRQIYSNIRTVIWAQAIPRKEDRYWQICRDCKNGFSIKIKLDACEPGVSVSDIYDITIQTLMPHNSSAMPGMIFRAKR